MAHVTVEVFPQAHVLPQCAIAAARDIAQDPVKLEVLTLTALFEVRELSSVVVGHEQGWKIEPHGLVS